jgi:hypothetical protein
LTGGGVKFLGEEFPMAATRVAAPAAGDSHPVHSEAAGVGRGLAPKVDTKSTSRTLLKLIDEYNYAKFTKKWV